MITSTHFNANIYHNSFKTLEPTYAIDSNPNPNSNLSSKIYRPTETQALELSNHVRLYAADGATDWSSTFMIVITIVCVVSAIIFASLAVYAFTAGLLYEGVSCSAMAILLGIKSILDLSEFRYEEKKLDEEQEALNNKEAIKKQIEQGHLLQAFKKIEDLDLIKVQNRMNFNLLAYPFVKACLDNDDIESLKKMALLISDSVKDIDPIRRNHLELLIIVAAKKLVKKSDIENARFLLLTTGGLSKEDIQIIIDKYNAIKDEPKSMAPAPEDEYLIGQIMKINKSRKYLLNDEAFSPVFTVADSIQM